MNTSRKIEPKPKTSKFRLKRWLAVRKSDIRAWDDVKKEMFYCKVEQFDDMLGFRFKHFDTEDPTYMWNIGVKDRNGEKVFQGDFVKIWEEYESDYWEDDPTHHIVVWGGEDYPAFTLKPGLGTEENVFSYLKLAADYNEVFEVVGNVHENPELLEKVEYS